MFPLHQQNQACAGTDGDDGGQITETPAQKQARRRAQEEVGGRVFPSKIILQPLRFEPERHNFQITDENLGVGGEKPSTSTTWKPSAP